MNLLRHLLGAKGRVNIATSPRAASGVAAAITALRVPGVRIGNVHTAVLDFTALTTVEYRYRHPFAEQLFLAEVERAGFAARSRHLSDAALIDPAAALFAERLGLDLTDWQRDILRRLEHRS